MEFKKLPVSKLTMNTGQIEGVPANPRQWTQADLDRLAASIEETPELLDARGAIVVPHKGKFVVLGGNMRLTAAKKLGLAEMPCAVLPEDTPAEKMKEIVVKDNGAFGAWDFDALANEWDDLPLTDWGVPAWKTEEDEEDAPQQVKEDDFNEETDAVETRCKAGDIWQLGEHRLMCGDSTKTKDIQNLTGGAKIDMCLTDPPYGMGLDTDFSGMQNHLDFAKEKGFTGGKKYEQGKVDEFHPEMINAVFTIDADEMFLWGADYFAELLPNKNNGSWIVWDKRANGNDDIDADYSSDKMYGSCFELCWSKKKHKRDIARVKWAGVFGTEQEFDHKRYHPTQKPIRLAGWFLERYSKEGDNVIDLFGGSGSTLLACEQLNRQCFMMELDPHYCDVIIARWEKLTGQQAKKIN